MTKEVVVTADEAKLAALYAMAGDDAGAGSDNVGSADVLIPYLSVLQGLSPELDPSTSDYVEGAKLGDIHQNVNHYIWAGKTGLLVVPCAFDRNIVEWVPREKGGGLVAVHDLNTHLMQEATLNDKKIPQLPNGNILVDTATHYVLYQQPDGRWEPAVISMKSTALKKSRLWNSLIMQQLIPGTERVAPRWLYQWRLTTVLETKDNNRWFNFEPERAELVTPELYARAKALNEQFMTGMARTAEIPF